MSRSEKRVGRLAWRWLGWTIVIALSAWVVVAIHHLGRCLPPGLELAGPAVVLAADQVRLLTDLTYVRSDGERVVEQQIFDELLAAVDVARERVVLDMFFFNPSGGAAAEVYRPLSEELTRRLIARRQAVPGLRIVLVTDPINTVYGGDPSEQLERLRKAGVEVVLTNLERVRDSNPIYSGAWRILAGWAGNSSRGGWLPHPFDVRGPNVTLRSWLRLLNFKANHRKLIVADDGNGGWVTIVTSANPHDASSLHSNVALRVEGPFAAQVVAAEAAVVKMSGGRAPAAVEPKGTAVDGDLRARFVTESGIREAVLDMLGGAGQGDEVLLAMFYLSHREVIGAIVDAAGRGAVVRMVLDPNAHAFGRSKPGIPNRQTATELVRRSEGRIVVRWYETHGEQFHTKLAAVRNPRRTVLVLGSANFTRRNLDSFNLEADVELTMPRGCSVDQDLVRYFERMWENDDGTMTVPYEKYRDTRILMRAVARFQEATGLCSF